MYFCFLFQLTARAADCPVSESQTFKLHVKSDTLVWVVGPNYPNGAYASLMDGNYNPNTYTGGFNIWETSTIDSTTYGKNLTFTQTFYVPGDLNSATIYFNVDDKGYFYINDKYTYCYSDYWFDSYAMACDVLSYISVGSNTLKAYVMNDNGQALFSYRLELELVIKGL